jgi:hypothetical protein
VKQGSGQGDLLTHAVAVVDHEGGGVVGQAQHLEQFGGAVLDQSGARPRNRPV